MNFYYTSKLQNCIFEKSKIGRQGRQSKKIYLSDSNIVCRFFMMLMMRSSQSPATKCDDARADGEQKAFWRLSWCAIALPTPSKLRKSLSFFYGYHSRPSRHGNHQGGNCNLAQFFNEYILEKSLSFHFFSGYVPLYSSVCIETIHTEITFMYWIIDV